MMASFVGLLLLLATLMQSSIAWPSGHPTNLCDQKEPNHGVPTMIQGGDTSFQVSATQSKDGCKIRVCVEALSASSQFKGFFLKGLRCGPSRKDFADHTGSFSNNTLGTKIICPGNSAVTQNSKALQSSACMDWRPSGMDCSGCVNFCATVVKSFELYHYDVCQRVMLQEPTTMPPPMPTTTPTCSADPCAGNGPCPNKQVCRLQDVVCVRAPCCPVTQCLRGCKPRKSKEFLVSGNCTSTKRLPRKECDGFCASGRMCQVTKTRERMFIFRCDGGVKMRLPVTLHQKCKCQQVPTI